MSFRVVAGLCAALAVLAPFPVAAQDSPLPDRRLVVLPDTDLPGSDISMLFDTNLAACQRACLLDPACRAFTFNQRSNACFPKSAASRQEPFTGALSALVRDTDPRVLARLDDRLGELRFLRRAELDGARRQAEGLGMAHPTGPWSEADWMAEAARARQAGNLTAAAGAVGAALNLSDAPDQWLDYGQLWFDVPGGSFSERRDRAERALAAAVNAYLRAEAAGLRASAAVLMAQSYERLGRGQDMIAPLRLAQSLQPRDDTDALLADAIGKYGFRIVGTRVETEREVPAICADFSEPLVQAGVDYAPFVQVPVSGLAVEASGNSLCVEGLVHGERYTLTFREGLPAASGEELGRSVQIAQYVRDRSPLVRFPGRAYVLPAAGPAAIPVEVINTETLDLSLMRVSDRNLVRAMRDEIFARPLPAWRMDAFGEGMAEQVWRGSATVEMVLNRAAGNRLPLGPMAGEAGTLEPGIYVLQAAIPGTDPWDSPAAHQWFVVSDLGLSTMSGVDGLHVVVRSLTDAGPVAGAEVRLVSRANRVLGSTTTDARGYALLPPGLTRGTGGSAPALVTVDVEGGADMAFLSLTEPEFDLSDRGVEGREPAPPVDVFLTTDRGVYRAGETVHVTALARDGDVRAVPGLPLTARMIRPDGVEYARHASQDAGAGGHVFALPVAPSAPRGIWRLEVLADPAAAPLARATFLIEDFLPERIDFDLAVEGDAPLRPGDVAELGIAARYLFGAPAAGLEIEGEVVIRARDGLEGFPGFRFGRHDEPFRPVMDALPWGNVTDDDGFAALSAPLPQVADPGRPLEAMFNVRLIEGSGRPVERSVVHPVAPAAPVLGIAPAFDGTLGEGEDATFRVVLVDTQGRAVSGRVKWTVNRVETRYQWYRSFGDWMWEPVTTRTRLDGGEAAIGADAPATIGTRVDWGRFELIVETLEGPYSAASTGFSAGWYASASAVDTPDMLEASLDRDRYRAGETATLRIVPRSAGTALVTVMSNRLIDMQVIEVAEGENLIALPVTDDWGAGAYVAATVLRPMGTGDARMPARALGLAHAGVDPGARRLSTEIVAPTEADPRGPLDVALRVKGVAPGETVHATIAAVDVGILNLTAFQPPDPAGHYFGQRRLGMGLRDLYGRLIDANHGTMGTIRQGGDAGARGRLQAPPPTEELVAYFSGPLTADADGMLRATFDLPAFNGTVRLMAVAWTATAVGQAQADVLVRDPVVVTASLPRFLAPGDESRLLLEITHAHGPAGRLGLDVAAPEGLRLGAVPSGLDLAEGGRARLEVPVTADAVGLYSIDVALALPDGRTLARSLMLPVQVGDPELSRQSRLTLAAGQSLTLDADLFAGLLPGSGSATLALGPMARLQTARLLRMLDRYPYGCTEQVAAAAMPLLYLADVAQVMGLGHADDLHARVDLAVRDVLTNQSASGSFGLWSPGYGDLWLDAFVTDFLSRARARGHGVPDTAFRMALDNLRNQVNYAPDFDSGGAPYAYALMVLAREGAAAVGDLRYYADVKPNAFDTPLAAGQLGAALAHYGDQTRADAMFARAGRLMAAQPATEGRAWRADYGTFHRDAAALLTLAVEAGSTALDLSALEERIALQGSRPLSSQEATWTLMAAHALIDRPGGEGFALNGEPVSGPLLRLLEEGGLRVQPVTLFNGSGRDAQITLTTYGVPTEPEPAAGNGYRITRSYYTLEGEPVELQQIAPGTRLVAVLEVMPFADDLARLAITDPLPGGFEIDNPNLLRGGAVRALDWLDMIDGVEHAEFRQDRFMAAVDWSGTGTLRLGYILRATTPGSYHHPAASVEDMYRPEFRARTDAGRVSVSGG